LALIWLPGPEGAVPAGRTVGAQSSSVLAIISAFFCGAIHSRLRQKPGSECNYPRMRSRLPPGGGKMHSDSGFCSAKGSGLEASANRRVVRAVGRRRVRGRTYSIREYRVGPVAIAAALDSSGMLEASLSGARHGA